MWCISIAMQITTTPRLAAATQGFSSRFVASQQPCPTCLRFASPLPSHAEQCSCVTSPCKQGLRVSVPYHAPAVRYHSEQCDSFAVPCRAVPRHCLSFDALPQQIISQPRDAIALQFRGDSWRVSALALHHSAPLALPLLAGAMLLPILRFSWLCPCYTVPRFALAHLFCALPSLSDAYHCLRCSARCFALANPGQSLPLLGYESVTIVILKNTEVKSKWIRKRKFGVLHKRRGFVLCFLHKRAGSGAYLPDSSGNAPTMRSAAR